MTLTDLQAYLKATGRYAGAIDGLWGRLTEGAILLALTDGPDTRLEDVDFVSAGRDLGVQPAAIKAFWKTEAAGAGFQFGKPKILPERHVFSRLTEHRFDRLFPTLSYPSWGRLPYPRTQDERYDMLLAMAHLNIDAGFGACSYGAPQILGSNYRLCSYPSAFMFAEAMARDEQTQLKAFMAFVANAGILPYLRKVTLDVASWGPVASRYNGSAYRANAYDVKMRDAFKIYGGH